MNLPRYDTSIFIYLGSRPSKHVALVPQIPKCVPLHDLWNQPLNLEIGIIWETDKRKRETLPFRQMFFFK